MRSVAISQAGGAEGRRFRFMRRVSQCRGLGGIAGRREDRGQVHYRADWLGAGGGPNGNGGDYFGRALRFVAPAPVAAVPIAALLLTRITGCRVLPLRSAELRVGHECVTTCRSSWSPSPSNTNYTSH